MIFNAGGVVVFVLFGNKVLKTINQERCSFMTNNDAGGIAVNPWIKHYQHLTGEEADPSPAKKKTCSPTPSSLTREYCER